MGKLCRIRLLRPDEIKKQDDGVSDSEFAVLAGNTIAAAKTSGCAKKSGWRKKQSRKRK